MIGFGILVGTLSHPVLYLQRVLTQRSPSSDFGENQLSRGLISLSLLLSSHLRIFQHPRVRSSTACYCSFNLLKSRSPPLRVYCQQLLSSRIWHSVSLRLRRIDNLAWPLTITRRLIMQKASSHPLHLNSVQMENLKFQISNLRSHLAQRPNGGGSYTLYAIGFRFSFTPLAGVLFAFPSRYWFTIGCQGVFSLIRWSGQIHAEFHVHRVTWDTSWRDRETSLTRLSRSMADFSKSLSSFLYPPRY